MVEIIIIIITVTTIFYVLLPIYSKVIVEVKKEPSDIIELNKKVEVLVEGKNQGKWFGRTRTDKIVFFESDINYQSEMIKVFINHTSPWSLSGEVIQD